MSNRARRGRINEGRTATPLSTVPPDLLYKGNVPPPSQGANTTRELGKTNSGNNPELFKAVRRQGYFITESFEATTEVLTLRPMENRIYLLLQNIDTAGNLLFGFGDLPTLDRNIVLVPNGSYEPFVVPNNDIYVRARVGTVKGQIIYATEAD